MKFKVHSPIPAKHLRRILMLVWIAIVAIAPWLTFKQNWGNGYQPYTMGQYPAIADQLLTFRTGEEWARTSNLPRSLNNTFDQDLKTDWPAWVQLQIMRYGNSYYDHITQERVSSQNLTRYLATDRLQTARSVITSDNLHSYAMTATMQDRPVLFQGIIEYRGGITPAHLELMLKHGFDFNQQYDDDNTPLTLTLISNLTSPLTEDPSIAYLLKRGADPNLYDHNNSHAYPPLFYTRYDSDDPHIEILLKYGADPYHIPHDESFIDLLRRQGLHEKADDIKARYPLENYMKQ